MHWQEVSVDVVPELPRKGHCERKGVEKSEAGSKSARTESRRTFGVGRFRSAKREAMCGVPAQSDPPSFCFLKRRCLCCESHVGLRFVGTRRDSFVVHSVRRFSLR